MHECCPVGEVLAAGLELLKEAGALRVVWQVEGERQYVSFVDPKGIRHITATDDKVNFRSTVQEIADRLGDPNVRMSSFMISTTPAATMEQLWKLTKYEMNDLNVLFQVEDKDSYVETMLTKARTGP